MSSRFPFSLKAIFVLTLSLVSASSAAESDVWTNVDPSNQNVMFWHNHTGGRLDALKAIVQTFNESNPYGITVTEEFQESYRAIFHKMQDVLGTLETPDLVVAYPNQAYNYQLSDALVDMTSLLENPKWGLSSEELVDFFPAFLKQDIFPQFGNARLGLAPNRSMEVLYYNRDWLAELGHDEPPSTPEVFKLVACEAAKTPFSKADGDVSMGYGLVLDASRLASWSFAFGADIFDYETLQYNYDSNGTKQAMAFLQSLYAENCARPADDRADLLAEFSAGRLLFTTSSSSGLPFYKDAVKSGANFEWDVAPLPHTTPTPVMNLYGASVSIPKSSPERELATWLFVKYFTSPAIQVEWAQASNYFPVRQSAALRLDDYFKRNVSYKTAFDLLQYGHHEPNESGYEAVRDMVSEALSATFVRGQNVENVLNKLNQDANANIRNE